MKSTGITLHLLIAALLIPTLSAAQTNTTIESLSPEGINAAPHFSPGIRTNAQQTIYVSGMTGQFNQNTDPLAEYEIQLRQAFEKVGLTLKAAGASPQDVVRQRILIVGISQKHAAITRKVMQEFYSGTRPTSTATGTSGLFNPDLVVEVDVTAVLAN